MLNEWIGARLEKGQCWCFFVFFLRKEAVQGGGGAEVKGWQGIQDAFKGDGDKGH